MAKGKCTMSVYHYYVALDSVLIACSIMVIAFATSGHHFWTTFAGIPRFILMLATFLFVGIFLGYQAAKHLRIDFPSWMPPDINLTHDSALLLPVSCFLDPDLVADASPYRSTLRNSNLLDRIGRPVKAYHLPQLWIYCCLLFALVLGISAHICEVFKRRPPPAQYHHVEDGEHAHPAHHRHKPNDDKRRRSGWEVFLWTVILSVCFATNVFGAWQINELRGWTRASGWMEDGAEDGVYSIGQLLPIFSLVLIVLSLSERVNTREYLPCLRPK